MGPIYNVDQIAQESTDRRGRPIARLVKAAVPSAPRARPRGALLTLVAPMRPQGADAQWRAMSSVPEPSDDLQAGRHRHGWFGGQDCSHRPMRKKSGKPTQHPQPIPLINPPKSA